MREGGARPQCSVLQIKPHTHGRNILPREGRCEGLPACFNTRTHTRRATKHTHGGAPIYWQFSPLSFCFSSDHHLQLGALGARVRVHKVVLPLLRRGEGVLKGGRRVGSLV